MRLRRFLYWPAEHCRLRLVPQGRRGGRQAVGEEMSRGLQA
jgi:hypothetical protein